MLEQGVTFDSTGEDVAISLLGDDAVSSSPGTAPVAPDAPPADFALPPLTIEAGGKTLTANWQDCLSAEGCVITDPEDPTNFVQFLLDRYPLDDSYDAMDFYITDAEGNITTYLIGVSFELTNEEALQEMIASGLEPFEAGVAGTFNVPVPGL